MRSITELAATVVLSVVLCGACQMGSANTSNSGSVTQPSRTPTPASVTKIDDRTRDALFAALADERKAEATYKAVMAKFGDVRPFSNIVNAERRHESFLLPLFEKYGVAVPENDQQKAKIDVPATLTEACRQGMEGEKANIAMYDGFLAFVGEEDIRETFVYLRDASKNNHLPAFERCASGRGMGRGRGRVDG